MNAKENDTNQAGALGRGLDSLMDANEAKQEGSRDERPAEPERHMAAGTLAVSGLIAGGAAGAVAIAAFVLLGVKAVLGMECSR